MVVFTNAGGPVGKKTMGGTYAGLSQVAVPFKGALGKMGDEEGMSVVEVEYVSCILLYFLDFVCCFSLGRKC
jgi:hypothetical protein